MFLMSPCLHDCIDSLLLFIRHTVIERLERRDELPQLSQMSFGNLNVQFQMLDSVHGLSVFTPVLGNGVHVFSIFPHHLSKGIP